MVDATSVGELEHVTRRRTQRTRMFASLERQVEEVESERTRGRTVRARGFARLRPQVEEVESERTYDPAVRLLVVDRSPSTRDLVAELLGDLAGEVVWVARDGAGAQLRAGIAAGAPFDIVMLEAEPAPTPAFVREL